MSFDRIVEIVHDRVDCPYPADPPPDLGARHTGGESETAVKTSQPSRNVLDDHDRARAHERLGPVDDVGTRRLRDPLWPADDDRRRPSPQAPPRPA
jgi:hypothetical protein